MKKVVKFSGIIALALSVLGFILIMATPCITISSDFGMSKSFGGVKGIFGANAQWCGTLAWIFVLISIIALIISLLPMLKITALEKFNNIFAIVAAVLLVIGGFILFFEASAASSNGWMDDGLPITGALASFKLGAGWIISGIMFIIAGLFSILPVFIKAE